MFNRYSNVSVVMMFAGSLFAAACDEPKPTTTTATATAATSTMPTTAAVASGAASALASTTASASASAAATSTAPIATLAAGNFDIDPSHSRMGFSVKHMMVSSTRGEFRKFTGAATINPTDLAKSSVTIDIDPDSIDTHEPKRDTHLKSPDFFDTKKFPKMTFKSTSIEKVASGYKVTGNLTMRDVTKPVTLDVDNFSAESKDPYGNLRTGTHATGKLNRTDFGLKYNSVLETGGVAVGEEVTLDFEIELIRKKEGDAKAPATK